MINSSLVPLVRRSKNSRDKNRKKLWPTVDYCSEENLKYLNKRKIEGFRSDEKARKHGQRREPCKPGPLPKGASRVEQMERKLQTQVGAAVYATRKFIVEPVFGPDQTGARIPTVPLTRVGESTR